MRRVDVFDMSAVPFPRYGFPGRKRSFAYCNRPPTVATPPEGWAVYLYQHRFHDVYTNARQKRRGVFDADATRPKRRRWRRARL